MKSPFIILTLAVAVPAGLHGQAISTPKQREALIASARALMANRDAKGEAPSINPFLERAAPAPPPTPEAPVIVKPLGAVTVEMLKGAALQIPATGTLSLGGKTLLLLGQKKLKVGDTIKINFEGRDLDLVLSSITSTSFTVTHGGLSYTRATRLPR